MSHDALLFLHIAGATVLLGTGAGIAFFMLMAHRSGDPKIIAHTAAKVVRADYLFTASAVVAQPVTGLLLASQVGWPLSESWIVTSMLLYAATGACWLPVVWLQTRMRNLATTAISRNASLPDDQMETIVINRGGHIGAFVRCP